MHGATIRLINLKFKLICFSNVHFLELDRNFVICIAVAVSCKWHTLYLPPRKQVLLLEPRINDCAPTGVWRT